MATFNEKVVESLTSKGMLPSHIEQVMEIVRQAPENAEMVGRWNEDCEDYPAAMLTFCKQSAYEHSVRWVEDNKPNAWFLPVLRKAANTSSI